MSALGVSVTDLMIALCCGSTCQQQDEFCHRFDFVSEASRVRDLLERKQRAGVLAPELELEPPQRENTQ